MSAIQEPVGPSSSALHVLLQFQRGYARQKWRAQRKWRKQGKCDMAAGGAVTALHHVKPLTICNLMTLPSRSTVRIFCKKRGGKRQAKPGRAQGSWANGEAAARAYEVDADGADVALRVSIILRCNMACQQPTAGRDCGGNGARCKGPNVPQTGAASMTCRRPSLRSEEAANNGKRVSGATRREAKLAG